MLRDEVLLHLRGAQASSRDEELGGQNANSGLQYRPSGPEMDNPVDSENARIATVAQVEQLQWLRQGDEYETTVLSGDPEKSGDFYVMRYRILIACDVAPHWHPEDEHATVIASEISLGFGEKFSADALRSLKAGSYALIPRQQPHFTHYAAGSVVQVHGIGPLVVNYIDP